MKRPNMRKTLQGHLVLPARRKKISVSLKKYFKTEKGILQTQRISKLNSERPCSDATKIKRSKSMLGNTNTKGKTLVNVRHW